MDCTIIKHQDPEDKINHMFSWEIKLYSSYMISSFYFSKRAYARKSLVYYAKKYFGKVQIRVLDKTTYQYGRMF